MRLALRNQETVPGPGLNVAPAQMKPRLAGEQSENLVLIAVHMKGRRVPLGA